ncbi:MAG TPA: MBL fold metallo-hydrolase [Herpetosiphonaceae bacterium]
MAELTILGSGTALPDADRENSCYVVANRRGLLMLDCGGSPYRLMLKYGLDPRELRAIFISHNHPDHLMGLPALLLHLWLVQRREPLHVFGNSSAIATARAVVGAAALGEHAITPEFHACPDDGGPLELPFDLGWRLSAAPTRHSRPTLALRLDDAETSLVYGADSGPCPALVELARGAHTLIHECTVPTPFESHSTPEEAAETARQAGVRRLILTHYSPRWTAPEPEVLARVRSAGFRGKIRIAHDGEAYDLASLRAPRRATAAASRARIAPDAR